MKNITESEPKPGIYFSPGFYMAFWNEFVLKNYSTDIILKHRKFKPYRELWVGAIIAASQSAASDFQHFVSMPQDEPPDVDISRLVSVEIKGRQGQKLERLPIEITRCDLHAGETLSDQIAKKNKNSWQNMKLAVYAYGDNGMPLDFQKVFDELQKKEKIWLEDIVVIRDIEQVNMYEVTGVYPTSGQSHFHANDPKAFFRHPEVFKKSRIGLGTKFDDLGTFKLLGQEFNS